MRIERPMSTPQQRLNTATGLSVLALAVGVLVGCNEVGTVDRLPDDATSLFERSVILLERGEFAESIDVLTKAIELSPADPRLYTDRGIAYEQLGEDANAEANYTKAIDVDSSYSRAYNNRAAVRARNDQLEEAIADLTVAIRLDPKDLLAHQNRSLAHFELGKYEAALADLDKADQIDPSNAVNFYRRGQTLRKLNRADDALSALDTALKIADQQAVDAADLALIRIERADALSDLNRVQDAIIEYRLVAQLDPALGTGLKAEALESTASIYAGLQKAGFEVLPGVPIEGFDLAATLSGSTHPVLIAEAINADEFRLSSEQAALLEKHPNALVAVGKESGDEALVVPASELSVSNYRPIAFAVRRPDVSPLPSE